MRSSKTQDRDSSTENRDRHNQGDVRPVDEDREQVLMFQAVRR